MSVPPVSAAQSRPALPAATTSAFPITTRLAAFAGIAATLILLVNVLKVASVVPTTTLTQLAAPWGQALAIVFVLGLAAAGLLPTQPMAPVATAAIVLALASGVGVEYVLNFVLRELPADVRTEVLDGVLTPALIIASVLLLIASVGFCLLLWQARVAPRALVVGFASSATVVSLRAFVPEWLFLTALTALALCILGLAAWLLRRQQA